MPLLRITCPECGAGLKSSTPFVAGQTVTCPKCEILFAVEDPEEEPTPKKAKTPIRAASSRDDDDEEDERPRKKKKKKRRYEEDEDDEPEWSYSTSWIRFVVLGVLLVAMVVLGILLVQKWQREKEATQTPGSLVTAT